MELSQLQMEVREWAKKNFPQAEKWEALVGLQEEVGELSHSFLKQHQNIRLEEDHRAKMVDAVGDIVIYLADFCHRNKIDMDTAVEETWSRVKQRDWTATSLKRGVVERGLE